MDVMLQALQTRKEEPVLNFKELACSGVGGMECDGWGGQNN